MDSKVSAGNYALRNRVKKAFLFSFIAFLSLTALMAVALVLFGSFGRTQERIIETTLVIAFSSVGLMSCVNYLGHEGRSILGPLGIGVTILACGFLLVAIWTTDSPKGLLKMAATLALFAYAFAHSLALMSVRLRTNNSWIQLVAALNIFSLASVLSSWLIWEIDNDSLIKVPVVLAIFVALESLIIPLLNRVEKVQAGELAISVHLRRRDDGLYIDRSGQLFEIKKISTEGSGLSEGKID